MDEHPGSPCPSVSSSATVKHHGVRTFSTSSLSSIGSLLGHRQHATPRSPSTLSLSLLTARRTSSSYALPTRQQSDNGSAVDSGTFRLVGVAESAYESQPETEATPTHDEPTRIYELEGCPVTPSANTDGLEGLPDSPEPQAFRRWVSKLRRKKIHKPVTVTPRTQRWSLDDFEAKAKSPQKQRPSRHSKQASYGSSIGFVTAVRSATATLASASIPTISRRNSKWRRTQQHSSLFSGSDPRPSVDTQRSIVDEAARHRSRKRREKVEELIRTEEGYVADLKALSNVTRPSHCS